MSLVEPMLHEDYIEEEFGMEFSDYVEHVTEEDRIQHPEAYTPAPLLETLFVPRSGYKAPQSFGSFFADCYLGEGGRRYQQDLKLMLKSNGWFPSKFQTPSQLISYIKSNGASRASVEYVEMMGYRHLEAADWPKAYSLKEINELMGRFDIHHKYWGFDEHPNDGRSVKDDF